ncbi:hypothetical protein [Polycladomyces subterraneus]|uniref:Uncharacterized protein n=1 Tax=Polycladomyces subterraneus TaxID=1016997 RepID=A0ABT8IM07_9BACL|nr:hypothetical protein [Polycladomyces subterraneus]MDN4593432.1 hypothetical protein [Polycladomyces subterraneus]
MTDRNISSVQRQAIGNQTVPHLVNSRWLRNELDRFCESYRHQRSHGWLDWLAEQGQGEQGRHRIMQLLRQIQSAQSATASPERGEGDSGPDQAAARRIAYLLTKTRKHRPRKKKQGR